MMFGIFQTVLDIAVLGLLLDLSGAVIIAVPDIPQLRKLHKPGRMREGLTVLEASFLHSEAVGYEDIRTELNGMMEQSIPEDAFGIQVVSPGLLASDETGWEFNKKIAILCDEEEIEETWDDTDYDLISRILERKIREGESYIRAVGFGLLAIGFFLQILAIIL